MRLLLPDMKTLVRLENEEDIYQLAALERT